MTVNEAIVFLQGMVSADAEIGELELLREGFPVGDFLLFDDAVHVRVIESDASEGESDE